jgi:hypothetical protein
MSGSKFRKYFVPVSRILCTIVQLSTCTNEHVPQMTLSEAGSEQIRDKKGAGASSEIRHDVAAGK